MISLPAKSFGDGFSHFGRTDRGGLVHPKGENSMAVPVKFASRINSLTLSAMDLENSCCTFVFKAELELVRIASATYHTCT